MSKRRNHAAAFKARVAVEALKGEKTAAGAIAIHSKMSLAELRRARFELARIDSPSAEAAKNLLGYFLSGDCREKRLIAALGEQSPSCGQCDNCRRRLRLPRRLGFFSREAAADAKARALQFLERRFDRAQALDAGEPEAPAGDAYVPPPVPSALDIGLARRLRALPAARLALARKNGVAPARLIADAALANLIDSPPDDLADLTARCGDETGLHARVGAPLLASARDEESVGGA
jgi:hypothetical protein